jgi:hypothetical protein
MTADSTGNVYLTGFTSVSGTSDDILTIKYNTDGVKQWKAVYNSPLNSEDFGKAICVDHSGNVYITGYSDSVFGNSHYHNITTIKYSSDGVQQWVASYDDEDRMNDVGNSITVDASGNVYITGYKTVMHGMLPIQDYVTIKYNSIGEEQWISVYEGPNKGESVCCD